jgi:hypothetical protein
MERATTGASDILFTLFAKKVDDITLEMEDAEELFDRLELLVTLEADHQLRRQESWTRAPIGRYGRKRMGDLAQERLTEYEKLPPDAEILKAGLLGGSQADALAVCKAFEIWLSIALGYGIRARWLHPVLSQDAARTAM